MATAAAGAASLWNGSGLLRHTILVAVLVLDLLHGRQNARAERTLELAELHDGDQRVLRALLRLGVGDRNLEALYVVGDGHVRGLRFFSTSGRCAVRPRTGPYDVPNHEPADGHHDGQQYR
jgi:hypothetical protein